MNRPRDWRRNWYADEDIVYRADVSPWQLGLIAIAVVGMSFGLWGLFSLMDSMR